GIALAAGFGSGAALAVQGLSEDAGDGGLADAAGAREQEGVVDAARLEGVGEGADDVFLADEFGEAARAPLAGEDQVGHGVIRPCGPPAPAWLTPGPRPDVKLPVPRGRTATGRDTERCPSG